MIQRHRNFMTSHLFPVALTAIAFAITGCSSNNLPIGEVPDGASADTAAGTGGAGTGGTAGTGDGGATGAGSGGMTMAGTGGVGTGGAAMADASPASETGASTDAADSGQAGDAPAGDGGMATGCERCMKYKQCCLAIYPGAANCSPNLDFCLSEPMTGGSRNDVDSECATLLQGLVSTRTNAGGTAPAACQ